MVSRMKTCYYSTLVLYTTIDRKLRNKLQGLIHYTIGVTLLFNGHEIHSVYQQFDQSLVNSLHGL